MSERIRANIEYRVSPENSSINFQSFVDFLLTDFNSDNVPVAFDAYFVQRRINKLTTDPTILYNAYIAKTANGFEITSKKNLNLENPSDRLLLAHEIAHTFQYEIKSHTIVDKYFFINGSKEQEFFCDFIARAILIPTIHIRKDFDPTCENFNSLKQINSLCSKYLVTHQTLLKRVLNDLRLFEKVVILRFILFKGEEKWKLFESFTSTDISNKSHFIPTRNYNMDKAFKTRFPSSGNILNSLLFNLTNEIKESGQEILKTIETRCISDKPLNTLIKNVNSDSIKINASLVENKKYQSKIINLLMRL